MKNEKRGAAAGRDFSGGVLSAGGSFDYASHSVGCAQDDMHGRGHSTGVSRNHAYQNNCKRRFTTRTKAIVILPVPNVLRRGVR